MATSIPVSTVLDLSHLFHGMSFDLSLSDDAVDTFLKTFVQSVSFKQQTNQVTMVPSEHRLIADIAANRAALPVSLMVVNQWLDDTQWLDGVNQVLCRHIPKQQQQLLRRELIYVFCILYAQYCLDVAEDRKQNQSDLRNKIATCLVRLERLNIAQTNWIDLGECFDVSLQKSIDEEEKRYAKQLQQAVDDSDKPLKYQGYLLGRLIAEQMVAFTEGKTVKTKEWMSQWNVRRLYWVWGRAGLESVLAMLPASFGNKSQAETMVAMPAPITGYMSWILYYTRFGINLSLLLKHTFVPTDAERQIPMNERFKTQWEQRKFSLLNDSIWGMANMVCFLWLTGNGLLGYMGNGLTAVLLLMDVCIATWQFQEEITQHRCDMLRLERSINALEQSIVAARKKEQILQQQMQTDKTQGDALNALVNELSALLKQKNTLMLTKSRCELDWTYKQYGLVNSWAYALGLLSAFAIVCCFFFPPAAILPASAVIFGVVGATLCFSLNVLYTAIGGYIEIAKSNASKRLLEEVYRERLQAFVAEKDSNLKKVLYLDLALLSAQTARQEDVIHIQKMKWVRSTFVDVLVPPLIFVAFMFMPLGVGLAVLAAGLALAFVSHFMLDDLKPKVVSEPCFNENDFNRFDKEAPTMLATLTRETESSSRAGLFSRLIKPLSEDKMGLNTAMAMGQNV